MTNDGPPVLPFDFWTAERFRAPFASRNIGYVLRAYRTDPRHRETYPNGISQSRLARWLRIDQAAVSDIELGRRAVDSISKTVEIAQKIGVPPELLWVKPAIEHESAESDADRIGLATLRAGAGLTQESFARKAEVNRSTVKRWETGEVTPPPHQWYAIAKILGVPRHRLAEALTHAEQTEQTAEPPENDVENNSEAPRQYNELFRAARESTPSEMTPGLCISRTELAEAVNQYLSQTTGKVHTALDARHIGRIERGQIRWPSKTYRTALRAVLGVPTDSELGFYPTGAARAARATLRQSSATSAPAATNSRAEPRIQLARIRKAEGYTQETLAHAIEVTRETVSHWETGDWEPSPYIRPRIAKALQISLEELDKLITPEETNSTSAGAPSNEPIRAPGILAGASQHYDDDVNRRTLLKLVGPVASLGITEGLEQVRRNLETVLAIPVSGRDADEWEQVAHEYACTVHVRHPLETLPLLAADFTDLCDTVARSKGSARTRLISSTAQLAALSAIALSSIRDYHGARRWWGTARRTAETVGSPELSALISGRNAVLSLYSAAPETVLKLADKAVADGNNKPCAGVLMGLSARVQTHARQGQHEDALKVLRQAVNLSEKLRTDEPANENSQWTWTEQRLRFIESEVHSYAGRIDTAFQAQDAALANFPASSFQGPAQIETHRAIALFCAGDTSAGLAHLARILEGLEPWQRSDGLIHQTVASALNFARSSDDKQRAQIEEVEDLMGAGL